MSLMRSADSSKTYSEPGLYGRSGDSSSLSAQIFTSDKQMMQCGLNSYQSDVYGQQYYSSVSSDLDSLNSINLSSTSAPGSLYRPQLSSSSYKLIGNARSSTLQENPYSSCLSGIRSQASSMSNNYLQEVRDPDIGMDYDEIEVKLKLQELERVLLSENDEDFADLGQEMSIDDDWVEPIRSLMPNSPKESSSGSNFSNISIITEARTLSSCFSIVQLRSLKEIWKKHKPRSQSFDKPFQSKGILPKGWLPTWWKALLQELPLRGKVCTKL
ncbi:hypothetical protein HPP92_000122 [Vanilla planifolia]|uniref:Uncharacterized protein n=1 Tax=Vanilla planifolia TaxID=51239 RepID=A0A835VK61_VANPL|nr:hypothetical protein HPP92_000122 [Vanilla planifolia]